MSKTESRTPAVPFQPDSDQTPRASRRRRWLLGIGAVIVACVLVWGVGTIGYAAHWWSWLPYPRITGQNSGVQVYQYTSVTDMPANLNTGSGDATINLSTLDVTQDTSMSIRQNDGTLQIHLPPYGNIAVHYTLGNGVLTISSGDNPHSGTGEQSGTDTWTRSGGQPTLTLTITMGSGVLNID